MDEIRRVPERDVTNLDSVQWEVRFSTEVSGVSLNDFNLLHTFGSPAPTLSISPGFSDRRTRIWTVTATTTSAQQEGTLRLDLHDADGSIHDQDQTRLDDPTVTGTTFRIDKVRPAVTLVRAPGQGVTTRTLPIRYRATFNEALATPLSAAGIACTGCSGGSVTVAGSGAGPYDITVDGLPGAGTVLLSIPGGRVTDEAGNLNTASAEVAVYYDPALVVVESIVRHSSDPNPANATATSLRWVVTFSQAVRNVDAADFRLFDNTGGSAPRRRP